MDSVAKMLPISGPAGKAAVLAIGTATGPHAVDQSGLPEQYFRVTNCEHMVELKEKFRRICERSAINKRYTYFTEEMLKENPAFIGYSSTSLNVRQEMLDVVIPALGAAAATKAIEDWGRPVSDITHLIFCNSSGASMPGADFELVKLLNLPLSTNRFMLYQQGCFGGGTVLRLAKDLAENNPGARVLVVCCEPTINGFRGPSKDNIQNLVTQALFGDGAGAVIVGAAPLQGSERALFEIMCAAQNIIPGSDGMIEGKLRESGLMISLRMEIPLYIAGAMPHVMKRAMGPLGISSPNDVFWVMHPGGRAIIDAAEMVLGMDKDKLAATREVLREYGNMSSASVLFVLETMRRRSEERKMATAGEGLEWGLLVGFGPGITIETVVLRCPVN